MVHASKELVTQSGRWISEACSEHQVNPRDMDINLTFDWDGS